MLFHICKLPPCLSFQQNCLLLLRQPIKRSCVVGVPNCFLPKGYVTRFSSTFTYNLSHQQLTKKRLLVEKLSSSSILRRLMHSTKSNQDIKKTSTLMYMSAVGVLVIGLTFAAVPMYRIFCQSTGYGGEIVKDKDGDHIASLEIIKHRPIKIHFNADVSARMQWKFKPQQNEVIVMPGETALAFYTATNPTDEPVIGISTYNVIPFEAGKYFNKIQCFCFEEQQLNPHEQVDMPVFFYIDPEFAKDPKMENVKEITLSYTFFEAKEGMRLPFAQLNKM